MSKEQKTSYGKVYHILAFCFADRATAGEVAQEVLAEEKLADYRVVAYAVVEEDEQGKSHIHQPGHGGEGAGVGAMVGGVLGLIGGPVGVLAFAAAGGIIGGLVGRSLGRAFPEKELKALGEQMQPNTSAFLVLVEDLDAESVLNDMVEYQANVVTLTVGDELSGEIATAAAASVSSES